ncbi:hypothetical protein [Shouchella lonarensis]|uniref:Uncharacterized protein n=1 Tax=Shouchella lonarensis TaxID=1464122 RepID=A0A1G6INT1_9BACI|nr:hypothetical protein [Shouchella lonarensis]SDC07665.1 hypothetical protein SAMN05421737_105112 [Shouchella lonarensis]
MKKKLLASVLGVGVVFGSMIGSSAMAGPPAGQQGEVITVEVSEHEVEPGAVPTLLAAPVVVNAAKVAGAAFVAGVTAAAGADAYNWAKGKLFGITPGIEGVEADYEQVKVAFDQ